MSAGRSVFRCSGAGCGRWCWPYASDQGQCVGGRKIGLRCGRHNRAGRLTILRRSVAHGCTNAHHLQELRWRAADCGRSSRRAPRRSSPGSESGVGGFGDLGVGDPRAGVGVADRPRILHRRPHLVRDRVDRALDRDVLAMTSEKHTFARRDAEMTALVPHAESPRTTRGPGRAGLGAVTTA